MKICSTDPAPAGFPQTVTLTVTSQQIADLMTSFIESGDPVTQGWIRSVDAHMPVGKGGWGAQWYANAAFYEEPGFIIQIVTENPDGPGERDHHIGACAFHVGLSKLAASPQYLYALTDLIHDAADASTADIVMQFVVFGKEVFA